MQVISVNVGLFESDFLPDSVDRGLPHTAPSGGGS